MFTKGQEVTIVANYDRKGTVYTKKAVVESCGKKRMTLIATDGTMLGRNYDPMQKQRSAWVNVLPTRDADTVQAFALALAQEILDHEVAHFARCLSLDESEAYNAAVRKSQSELHEIRVIEK